MYNFHVSGHLEKILKKLSKKDKLVYNQILNKIDEIIQSEDVDHYKNLRYNMKDSKRVHIGSFVLVFQYDNKNNMITFDDFDHYDTIYKKKVIPVVPKEDILEIIHFFRINNSL